MKVLLTTVFSLLLIAELGITPSGRSYADTPVLATTSIDGTVESVDPRNLTVTIKTDSGETQSLTVASKSVLARVVQGERVRCELKDGKVSKIVKATPTPKAPPARQPTKGELGG